jgi:dCTP deaminase
MSYVPFGERFVLHPGNFVLAVTLEWLRLPADLAGYVVGKSSWGRRGLIIATATGVHPSFTGCLTLELANVGELPIAIYPGMEICQIFLHRMSDSSPHVDQSAFVGFGRPVLGRLIPDEISVRLKGRKEE